MKSFLVASLASVLVSGFCPAALLAHVDTTEGRITVELQHDKAPLAVANFITLVQGTRPHIDSSTGNTSTEPYYIGETFFRVIDDAAFKIAQTGSGTGTNQGGPGYTFPDEFDPSLRHVPYVLSMANSGPNTNGSQIFFVGNSSPSHLDDVHTVFGLIPDPASRAVIDAIHAAGNDGSSITDITFERTDSAAVAFDELDQGLPEVEGAVSAQLSVTIGESISASFPVPIGEKRQVWVHRSDNLSSWIAFGSLYRPNGSAPLTSLTGFEPDFPARRFYRISTIHYPTDPSTRNRNNAVFSLEFEDETRTYTFGADGQNGTTSIAISGGPPVAGTFSLLSESYQAFAPTLIVDHGVGSNPRYVRYSFYIDGTQPITFAGRVKSELYNGLNWFTQKSGTFNTNL